ILSSKRMMAPTCDLMQLLLDAISTAKAILYSSTLGRGSAMAALRPDSQHPSTLLLPQACGRPQEGQKCRHDTRSARMGDTGVATGSAIAGRMVRTSARVMLAQDESSADEQVAAEA